MTVIHHPHAEAELIEAGLYYESKQPGLGGEFLGEIDASVDSILRDPRRLPTVEGDVRRQFVRRFPYEIYFRVVDEVIRILAVKHHRRHSDSWKGRR